MQGLEPVVSVVGMRKGTLGMDLSDEFEITVNNHHHHHHHNQELIRDVVTAPF